MTVMPIDDQAPEQSLEEQIEAKVAARFGGTPEEQPAEEAVPEDIFELDWEGEKYNLPAKLKSAFMMQKDYTQKTQETAELRKTYEHTLELAKSAQLERAFYESIGTEQQELSVIEAYLAQMQKADWSNMDTGQVLKTKIELDNVKERKAALKEAIAEKRGKFIEESNARTADMRLKARELASKSISGFSEETEKSIRSYAASKGLTEAQIDNVLLDPRSVQILHDGMQYQKVQSGVKAVTTKPGVLKVGPGSERMPPDVVSKLNFRKAISKATTSQEKANLIQDQLANRFAKRK